MPTTKVTVFFRPKGATYEPYQTQVDGYIALEAISKGFVKMGYELVKTEGDVKSLPGWTKAPGGQAEALTINDAWNSLCVGTMFLTAPYSANRPDDWMEAKGQSLSQAEYPELYKMLGQCYGLGDGEGTFNLPTVPDSYGLPTIIKVK